MPRCSSHTSEVNMVDDKLIGKLDQVRDTLQDKLIQLNRDFRSEFEDLKNNLPEPEPVPEPVPVPEESDSLLDLIAAMDLAHEAVTQGNLLKALVQGAGTLLPRVLLLIKKSGNLHGWACSGFSDNFEKSGLKKVCWPVDRYPELGRVVAERSPLAANFSEMGNISEAIEAFDGFVPFKACIFPLVVKNKVVAVLYTDSGSEPQLKGREKVQLLVHAVGLELTLVAAKVKTAPIRPILSEPMDTVDAAASSPAPHAGSGQEALSSPNYAESSSTFDYSEPQLNQPESAPKPSAAEDEDPIIKKAKRAARVLVADLKLYNEDQVAEAKKRGDLYSRIKEDIDRSYSHYKERIADLKAPANRNFFKEEIIRQLGDDDANCLGPLPF